MRTMQQKHGDSEPTEEGTGEQPSLGQRATGRMRHRLPCALTVLTTEYEQRGRCDSGPLGNIASWFYARRCRQRRTPVPTTPTASIVRVAGSGTGEGPLSA